jgi:hypothetical protein
MTGRILKGRCFCGAVEYEVHDAFEYAGMCHCSDCRRVTGSAFKPFAGILKEALTVIKGADVTTRNDKGDVHDVHCRICCSLLYSVVREGRYAHVAMGTLTDDPAIRPTEHIFVSSKAPWFTITDDLPQYAGHSFEGPPLNRND